MPVKKLAWLDGARYRPTPPRIPTEAYLRRAHAQVEEIKARIKAGTFVFEECFPQYRNMERVMDPSQIRTCNRVFDQVLANCEARLARHDLAASTVSNYRRIVDNLWRPEFGRNVLPQGRSCDSQSNRGSQHALE